MREQGGWGGTEFMSLGLKVVFLPISKFVFFFRIHKSHGL